MIFCEYIYIYSVNESFLSGLTMPTPRANEYLTETLASCRRRLLLIDIALDRPQRWKVSPEVPEDIIHFNIVSRAPELELA